MITLFTSGFKNPFWKSWNVLKSNKAPPGPPWWGQDWSCKRKSHGAKPVPTWERGHRNMKRCLDFRGCMEYSGIHLWFSLPGENVYKFWLFQKLFFSYHWELFLLSSISTELLLLKNCLTRVRVFEMHIVHRVSFLLFMIAVSSPEASWGFQHYFAALPHFHLS